MSSFKPNCRALVLVTYFYFIVFGNKRGIQETDEKIAECRIFLKKVFSLNFSSVGKGPFLIHKAKNTMYAPYKVFAFMKDFIFEHPVNQLTKSILNTSKQRIL